MKFKTLQFKIPGRDVGWDYVIAAWNPTFHWGWESHANCVDSLDLKLINIWVDLKICNFDCLELALWGDKVHSTSFGRDFLLN